MKKQIFTLILVIAIAFSIVLPEIAIADKCVIPIEPGVNVFEPGQKAIIAWNGTTECLIISTDVISERKVKVLEILPLPSEPDIIELADFQSFLAVQEYIFKKAPKTLGMYRKAFGEAKANQVSIVFHEKLGFHDITVIHAENLNALIKWIKTFLKDVGLEGNIELGNFREVISDYMARGFYYFSLDIIEVPEEERSVEPIFYRFKTQFLYYPLKISAPIGGQGKITLYVICLLYTSPSPRDRG